MLARIILTTLFAAAPLSVQALTETTAQTGSNPDTTFLSRAPIDPGDQFVDIRVLRNFDETITLGTDRETGAALYPHRSVALSYRVDCVANRLAVSEWQMFGGNLATGQIVWNQKNSGKLGFIDAVNPEMRAVMRSACATNTVLR